jgi:5-(carboxyamino)imidazole ribonucleotide mutase
MSGVTPLVLVLFGSESDLPKVEPAFSILADFEVPFGAAVVSAHRDPERLKALVRRGEEEGVRVFVCAAGLAAHLAGVTASLTVRPVIGVPLSGGTLGGQDALLATVQMPRGVPVATVGVDRADNAALLAVEILALGDARLGERLLRQREAQRAALREQDERLQQHLQEAVDRA